MSDNEAAEQHGKGWVKSNNGGEPIWAGADSIINAGASSSSRVGLKHLLGTFGGITLFVAGFYMIGTNPYSESAGLAIIQIVCLFTAIGAGAVLLATDNEWVGAAWILELKGGRLEYRAGNLSALGADSPALWTLSVDDAARVESGRTTEWQLTRRWGSDQLPISEHEYQVFLFSGDSRRLIIYTANAAREDCARLAYSVRAALEAKRVNATPAAAPLSSARAGKGFDL